MEIKNYTLSEEIASKAKAIYFPGAEGETEQLQFQDRNDERPNPLIVYTVKGIPNSHVQVTLNPMMPLIEHIDLMGEESDMEKIIAAVDKDFGIELASADPRP